MKKVLLLHNQEAGDEDYFTSELVQAIEHEGFSCEYFSVKNDNKWENHLKQGDFIVAAGGDGTIRRIMKELVKKKSSERAPVAILPMGTANNLSKALNLHPELKIEKHVQHWEAAVPTIFDLGEINNADRTDYFLEGAGYGLFPDLIQKMSDIDMSHLENTDDRIKRALKELHNLALTSPAVPFQIESGNQFLEGKALLLEIMNIPSVGPNLVLASNANIDDGLFDVVLIEEHQRHLFADFVKKLSDGKDMKWNGKSIRAKKITVDCKSEFMHIDDQLIINSQNPSTFLVMEKAIRFLI